MTEPKPANGGDGDDAGNSGPLRSTTGLEFAHNTLDVLYLAAGVGAFIIALTIYLRFGSDNGGDHA